MNIEIDQLKKFLLDAGLIAKADLETLFVEAGSDVTRFEDLLVSSGKISEDDLRRAKAYILGIPFVDLRKEKIPYEVISVIPEPIARKHNIVAFRKTDRELEIAMLDPEDFAALDFIKKGVGLRVLPRLTDTESIKNALLQYQKSLKAEFGELIQKETKALAAIKENTGEALSESDLAKLAEDVPVVRIVDALLSHAIFQKASDIHIEPYEKDLIIRYRIDGLLHDAMILPKETAAGITARIKVLANLRLDEKRLPQDGRFKIVSQGVNVSFRVSSLPTYFGEKIVMRLLPDAAKGFTLEASGFHGINLERMHEALRRANGMILVTGPTGSGKTTTLYTALEILNTPDVNISTIEDPIEYQMPRINQTQVKPEIGLTFGNGLRALVRQDPDIIMVGEIRDKETVQLAINAALTGHLVLSTLHTNSAAATIPRLLDMGAEPFLVVSTVNVVVAQRLVRRLSGAGERHRLGAAELKKLNGLVNLDRVLDALKAEKVVGPKADWSTIDFTRVKASADVEEGFSGRIGIHEVMTMTPTIRELVMSGATGAQIEAQAKKEGMLGMLEDGIFKAVQGLTTIEEVLRVVTE